MGIFLPEGLGPGRQAASGASWSWTVTVKLQELELPATSTAVTVTVVVPTGKTEPDGGEPSKEAMPPQSEALAT